MAHIVQDGITFPTPCPNRLWIHQVYCFFFYLGFLLQPFMNHGMVEEKGKAISLTPHCHFHLLHRYQNLEISWVMTADSSPLHISNSWTQTGNLWFLSASCQPLSYASHSLQPAQQHDLKQIFEEGKYCAYEVYKHFKIVRRQN